MKKIYIYLLISILSISIIYPYLNADYVFNFIHLSIILISINSLFKYDNVYFSFYKLFHFFNLFFFGISPILQNSLHIRFLYEPILLYQYKLFASLIILVSILMFTIFYDFYFKRVQSSQIVLNNPFKLRLFVSNYRISLFLLILSCISFYCIFYINNFSFLSLLFRGGEYSDRIVLNKSLSLIIEKFIRPISLSTFIFAIVYFKKSYILKVLLGFIFVITCFPTSLGRNAIAGYYLPLFLIIIPYFYRRYVFVLFFLFSFLIAFPFFNSFRYFSAGQELSLSFNYDMFTELHFDAYASFVRVIQHGMITYGNQLLGVFLFFIPREFWINKPESSGVFQAEILRFDFNNISCPYIAEGYINFGVFGSFIFIFILFWICFKCDKRFWCTTSSSLSQVLYALSLSLFIFILRGDLMNGFSYLLGSLTCYYFVQKISLKLV